jgi:hypothetical protein
MDQEQIKDFAQIVHLYYADETFSLDEVDGWLWEIYCELKYINDSKITFLYFDEYYPVKMTVYKNGKCIVETDLGEM